MRSLVPCCWNHKASCWRRSLFLQPENVQGCFLSSALILTGWTLSSWRNKAPLSKHMRQHTTQWLSNCAKATVEVFVYFPWASNENSIYSLHRLKWKFASSLINELFVKSGLSSIKFNENMHQNTRCSQSWSVIGRPEICKYKSVYFRIKFVVKFGKISERLSVFYCWTSRTTLSCHQRSYNLSWCANGIWSSWFVTETVPSIKQASKLSMCCRNRCSNWLFYHSHALPYSPTLHTELNYKITTIIYNSTTCTT